MAVACIDTEILFWAIVKHPPKGNEHLVREATDFMNWVKGKNYRVIIPSIVLGELLVAVPVEDHVKTISQFESDWRIVPYDTPSAHKFAEMRRDHIIQHRLIELHDPKQPEARKGALKADVMIIATAIAHKADVIFGYDKNMLKLTQGFIEAYNFLDVEYQMSLPFEEDNGKNSD